MLPCQLSASVCPSRPRTRWLNGGVGDLEAGAEDDRVDLVLDCRRRRRSEVSRTSRMPAVTTSTLSAHSAGYQVFEPRIALAAEPVVGHELRPQLGVGDLLGDVGPGTALGHAA